MKASLFKNLKLCVRAGGGWGKSAQKALALWRAEGTLGLRRALAVLEAQRELSPQEGGFAPGDYAEWIRRYDTLIEAARAHLRRRCAGLGGPSMGLVLLPDTAGEAFLDQTLSALRGQIWTTWELFAPLPAFGPQARDTLARHASEDPRIRLLHAAGPAEALSAAQALATGAFLGFLRAGDELPEQALACAALGLADAPGALLLYADEDGIDAQGRRYAPWFKPDRNPELMLAQDMFSGLCLLNAEALRRAGGPGESLGPLLAYDLAWRVIDQAQAGAQAVLHLPRVLCHRRRLVESKEDEGGTALRLRAAQAVLDREGQGAKALPAPGLPAELGAVRALYPRPAPDCLASILIPTRDRADLLALCLGSILEKTVHKGYEIIVIDNGSVEDATFRLFDEMAAKGVRIVKDPLPFNYSRVNNKGAAEARGQFLCLMNNDIEVLCGDWLGEMLSHAQRPGVGCVGARLWYPDGTLQHGGILRGVCGFAGHAHLGLNAGEPGYFGRAALSQELSAVTAACLVLRREIFDQVGGLDEALPESYNDVDLCLRVRAAGYRNVWTPYAELRHYESASRRNRVVADPTAMSEQERRTTRIVRSRWGVLAEDPAYNPNLTRLNCSFGLAWPPRTPPLKLL